MKSKIGLVYNVAFLAELSEIWLSLTCSSNVFFRNRSVVGRLGTI